jgi:hypothetical protein
MNCLDYIKELVHCIEGKKVKECEKEILSYSQNCQQSKNTSTEKILQNFENNMEKQRKEMEKDEKMKQYYKNCFLEQQIDYYCSKNNLYSNDKLGKQCRTANKDHQACAAKHRVYNSKNLNLKQYNECWNSDKSFFHKSIFCKGKIQLEE